MAKADDLAVAEARAAERRRDGPVALAAHYDRGRGRVVVVLGSGVEVAIAPRSVQGLEKATGAELAKIEISPSGLGLHFPKIDADLYLPTLLEGVLGSRRWMAAQLGAEGGKARSNSKLAAARSNGKLGGRPRKAVGG